MADTLADIMHSKLAAKYPTLGAASSIDDLLLQFSVDNPTYIRPFGSLSFYSAGPTESLSDAAYRWWSAYAGGSSSPFDLTNLSIWFDASDDAAFVFSSGNIVSQWKDKSPNLLHTTFAGGTQPTRIINAASGLPVVTFPSTVMQHGSTDTMLFVSPSNSRDTMWFSVVIFDATPTGNSWCGCGTGASAINFYVDVQPQWSIFTSGQMAVNVGSSYFHAPSITVGALNLWAYLKQVDADIVRVNGTDVPTDTNSSTAGPMVSVISPFYVGVNYGGGGGFNGKVAEIICINRYNQAQRDSIETYLKTKWGIP